MAETQICRVSLHGTVPHPEQNDLELEPLVWKIMERALDKWTMLASGVLAEQCCLRLTRAGELIGVSQNILVTTGRQTGKFGLALRTVLPDIPPGGKCEIADPGHGEAYSGVWTSGERHREAIMKARKTFQELSAGLASTISSKGSRRVGIALN